MPCDSQPTSDSTTAQIPDEGSTFLVNYLTRKHTGPFTTRHDALLARSIAADSPDWAALSRAEFDTYLGDTGQR